MLKLLRKGRGGHRNQQQPTQRFKSNKARLIICAKKKRGGKTDLSGNQNKKNTKRGKNPRAINSCRPGTKAKHTSIDCAKPKRC